MIKSAIALFITVFFTMVMIYFIKTMAIKYNIPFVKKVAETV